MAIIKCPSCGTLVSDHARKCPKCGRSIFVTPTALVQDKTAIANLVGSITQYKEQIFEMEYAKLETRNYILRKNITMGDRFIITDSF